MNSETSNKIVVIGAGNVGETICYTLMLRAQVGEIVLIWRSPRVQVSRGREISSRADTRNARTRRLLS